MRLWLRLGCVLLFSSMLSQLDAATTFKELEAGGKTYYRVRVKEVTPKALVILHSKGIAQVMLKDLSPQLQKQFGYEAEKVETYQRKLEEEKQQAKAQAAAIQSRLANAKNSTTAQGQKADTQSVRALSLFGQPPKLAREIDLRTQYRELGIITKDQGRRPSCSVFAVVSALEFQNAKIEGSAEKLSEEYLIWATRQTLGIRNYQDSEFSEDEDGDAGFRLQEVVQAVRTYGIPLQTAMPNTYGKSMAKIDEPSSSVIEEARNRRKVHAYEVTGRDRKTKIDNIVHALNEGVPVVVGMQWPVSSTLENAPVLSKQKPRPDYAHAVTLVGYRSDGAKHDTLRFVFKNSWGNRWGINGYGWVTYEYLEKHLHSAVLLDVTR